MPQCDHEEADTRIIVHVRHAFKGGSESVLVRTVDTDVVVILVGKFHDLMTYNQRAVICVAFGMGRYFTLIDINTFCSALGETRSRSLPVFHAFTGCDCTFAFYGIGKPTAWKIWQSTCNDVTPALEHIATHPFEQLNISSKHFKKLERLTVLMYDKSSPLESVNETRMMLFPKSNLDNIPPTQVSRNVVIDY